MRWWVLGVLPWLVACGGQGLDGVVVDAEDADAPSGGTSGPASVPRDGDRDLSDAELGATWQALALPLTTGVLGSQVEAIARVPDGFLVLVRDFVGNDGKVALPRTHLYASADGLSWSELDLGVKRENFGLRGLAYSGGRYVMAGDRYLWTSNDGRTWSEQVMSWNDGSAMSGVVVSNGRFFVQNVFRHMLVSSDGASWTEAEGRSSMYGGIAYGNGRYVMTGVGPVLTSNDGVSWQEHQLDCSLPGAVCITTPDSDVPYTQVLSPVFYLAGRFYTGELVSDDGSNWFASGMQAPYFSDGGYLFALGDESTLTAWRPGGSPTAIATRAAEAGNPGVPSGASCATQRCIVLGDQIYLAL
jgi:hypothetical protein